VVSAFLRRRSPLYAESKPRRAQYILDRKNESENKAWITMDGSWRLSVIVSCNIIRTFDWLFETASQGARSGASSSPCLKLVASKPHLLQLAPSPAAATLHYNSPHQVILLPFTQLHLTACASGGASIENPNHREISQLRSFSHSFRYLIFHCSCAFCRHLLLA
jgi:hypothetical protein